MNRVFNANNCPFVESICGCCSKKKLSVLSVVRWEIVDGNKGGSGIWGIFGGVGVFCRGGEANVTFGEIE